MLNKKNLKLFGIVFLVNIITLFIEILVFGVRLNKLSLTLLFLFGIIETVLIDKLAIKEGGIV